MYLQGGKLYGIKTTGHTLYELLIFPNGLKPSLARPSLTLRESAAKYGYYESKFFQAIESVGCLIFPSSLKGLSLCHLISLAVLDVTYNCCNLGAKGK